METAMVGAGGEGVVAGSAVDDIRGNGVVAELAAGVRGNGLVVGLASLVTGLASLVTSSVSSEHSKRAYAGALAEFVAWKGERPFTKQTVNEWRAALEGRGLAPASVNQRLTAVRKLALEAGDNGLMAGEVAAAIGRVRGVRRLGRRCGNWLTEEDVRLLLRVPDGRRVKGVRDRAILAVLVGCGLRRAELAGLTWDRLQQREGRWCIVDLVGKGGRVRTVPVPAWAMAAVERWREVACGEAGGGPAGGGEAGPVFRAVDRWGKVVGGAGMTSRAVYDVVREWSARIGRPVAAHDLRRTLAKLSRKKGCELEQIQATLGHASVVTTERYVGGMQDLAKGPGDWLDVGVWA